MAELTKKKYGHLFTEIIGRKDTKEAYHAKRGNIEQLEFEVSLLYSGDVESARNLRSWALHTQSCCLYYHTELIPRLQSVLEKLDKIVFRDQMLRDQMLNPSRLCIGSTGLDAVGLSAGLPETQSMREQKKGPEEPKPVHRETGVRKTKPLLHANNRDPNRFSFAWETSRTTWDRYVFHDGGMELRVLPHIAHLDVKVFDSDYRAVLRLKPEDTKTAPTKEAGTDDEEVDPALTKEAVTVYFLDDDGTTNHKVETITMELDKDAKVGDKCSVFGSNESSGGGKLDMQGHIDLDGHFVCRYLRYYIAKHLWKVE